MRTKCEPSDADLTDPVLKIKHAFRMLVKQAGGVEAAAAEVGISIASISNYTNPNKPDQVRVDVMHALERAIGDPVMLRVLADLHGFELTPKAPADGDDHQGLDIHLPDSMDVTLKAAEIGQALADAIERGVMTEETALRIEDRCGRIVSRAVKMRDVAARIRAIVKKSRKPWSLRARVKGGE
ncbi:hypothetical protein J2847_005832 [Azospirillum agricola]|uniref:phage regulatory CII family protein n=1 Tax=Azospirillum agricola TaxID=1720247 RepID=UPI001AE997B9|nr:phage regulatory CII family protein [Azospirillum agricola]MBP2232503.1 hypothetical protein [Azospirillum agricola]